MRAVPQRAQLTEDVRSGAIYLGASAIFGYTTLLVSGASDVGGALGLSEDGTERLYWLVSTPILIAALSGGVFLLVYRGDGVVGCGGVRTMAPAVGELKRMWIHPDNRGTGLGSLLLSELIEQSRALGHTSLLLDTNRGLTEALAMYSKHGFEPIERYNDNPDATDFLRKTL